jgi:hypothetical protein
MICEFFEPNRWGGICHTQEDMECPKGVDCNAKYDAVGNLLHQDEEEDNL